MVIAKVSKTSNLIWLFTGQLIHAGTGEIVLDDSTELKGRPGRPWFGPDLASLQSEWRGPSAVAVW